MALCRCRLLALVLALSLAGCALGDPVAGLAMPLQGQAANQAANTKEALSLESAPGGIKAMLGFDDSCAHIFGACCQSNAARGIQSCTGKLHPKGGPLVAGDNCASIFVQCCESKAEQGISDDTCDYLVSDTNGKKMRLALP